MADMQQLEALIPQLADYQTRHAARKQIEAMGPVVAGRLLPLLTDPALAENSRWAVLSLFTTWRHLPATPTILEVARADRGLHGEAVHALEVITGLQLGEDFDEWEKALADPAAYATQEAAARQMDEGMPTEERQQEKGYNIFRRALASTASEFKWEEEGYLYMRFELKGRRKQQIVATFQGTDPSGHPLVTLYTECGPSTPEAIALMARRNVTTKYGRFVIEGAVGEEKVVMRENIPLVRLTEDLARDVVMCMATAADSLENELTHADHI